MGLSKHRITHTRTLGVQRLRQILFFHKVTWGYFTAPRARKKYILDGVRFYARAGKHLGQWVCVIMANEQFVVVKPVHPIMGEVMVRVWDGKQLVPKLDPTQPTTGGIPLYQLYGDYFLDLMHERVVTCEVLQHGKGVPE